LASIARKQGVDPSDIEIWFGDEAASVRRTRSPVAEPDAAAVLQHLQISAPPLPTSSAPSVPKRARQSA
jgi:hypothetical protein